MQRTWPKLAPVLKLSCHETQQWWSQLWRIQKKWKGVWHKPKPCNGFNLLHRNLPQKGGVTPLWPWFDHNLNFDKMIHFCDRISKNSRPFTVHEYQIVSNSLRWILAFWGCKICSKGFRFFCTGQFLKEFPSDKHLNLHTSNINNFSSRLISDWHLKLIKAMWCGKGCVPHRISCA